MSDEFKVVCGECQFDVAILLEADGEIAICPVCGQMDELKEARRVAGEHFLHRRIPDLQNRIRNAAKDNDPVNLTANTEHSRSYRWHAVPL